MHEEGYLEMEDPGHEPPMPELKLALAVVCAALFDCRRASRKTYTYEKKSERETHKTQAEDAKDFLLRRLNDQKNPYGEVLRYYGMRPLTEERIARLVRLRPTRAKRQGVHDQRFHAQMFRTELLPS